MMCYDNQQCAVFTFSHYATKSDSTVQEIVHKMVVFKIELFTLGPVVITPKWLFTDEYKGLDIFDMFPFCSVTKMTVCWYTNPTETRHGVGGDTIQWFSARTITGPL